MKKIMSMAIAALLASYLLAGCVIAPGPPDYGVEVAPPLPTVVEFGDEPYYYYRGYNYRYDKHRWHYSRERSGPWRELPETHWPKEIRHRGEDNRGGEIRHERDERR